MLFRYIALLDMFTSDAEELDLSYEDRTFKIRRIPRSELEEFLLLPSNDRSAHIINERLEMPIIFGKGKYWIDYRYDVDSEEDMVKACNIVEEEMAQFVLSLRLFTEGCVCNVFSAWIGEGLHRHFTRLNERVRMYRSDWRNYFVSGDELSSLKNFQDEFSDIAWEKLRTPTSLGIALSRFVDGYERTKLEDKIIDHMIGLEALYLQGEGIGEFGYKLAHRVSTLLANDREERRQLFAETKKSYALRSKVVHGLKYDLSPQDVWFVEDLLRGSIKKFLKTPKPKWLDLIF